MEDGQNESQGNDMNGNFCRTPHDHNFVGPLFSVHHISGGKGVLRLSGDDPWVSSWTDSANSSSSYIRGISLRDGRMLVSLFVDPLAYHYLHMLNCDRSSVMNNWVSWWTDAVLSTHDTQKKNPRANVGSYSKMIVQRSYPYSRIGSTRFVNAFVKGTLESDYDSQIKDCPKVGQRLDGKLLAQKPQSGPSLQEQGQWPDDVVGTYDPRGSLMVLATNHQHCYQNLDFNDLTVITRLIVSISRLSEFYLDVERLEQDPLISLGSVLGAAISHTVLQEAS